MKIYFVDENEDQRTSYRDIIRRGLPAHADIPQIVDLAPKPTLPEMDFLVQDPESGAIILDERLKDLGTATYFGIELAAHLRNLNPHIPIYILTNEPDAEEIEGSEGIVEGVLSKQDLSGKIDIVCSRILRGINTYAQIKSERELRFEELIRKSLDDVLSSSEEDELKDLNYSRYLPDQVDEIAARKDCDRLVALNARLEEIEGMLNKK